MKGQKSMPPKTSKKPITQVKNGATASKARPENTLAATPEGYWRAPVYGVQWPTAEHASGAVVSGVLADLDSCQRWDESNGAPLPAIVLVVDDPTRAFDPMTGEIVTVPARGAVRIIDPGFMKFSRLLSTPGKVPHLFVRLLRTRHGARYVVDVSAHPHNAADYGLEGPPPAASGSVPS